MAGDWLSNAGSFLTGGLREDDYGKLPQAVGPDKGAYQIGGLDTYQNTLNGLSSQIPGSPDFMAQNAGQMGNQEALQKYFQSVALGQAPTAADKMFQNAAAQNARQAQSAAVSAGGMNPALAMRQMFGAQAQGMGDIAGKAAVQKAQDVKDYGNMAQNSSQAIVAQRMQQAQQQFQDQMSATQAKKDIADGIFSASRAQTAYNVDFDKNKQAFSQIQRMEAQKKAEDLARSRAAIIKMGAGALMTAGGAVLTATGAGAPVGMGMMGAGAGIMGGAAAGGGGGGVDPDVLRMLMSFKGQGGGYRDPYSNADGSMNGSGTGTVGGG